MKKISYILIFVCAICLLNPVSAQTFDAQSITAHPTAVYLYERGSSVGNWVTTVDSGVTAHITAELGTLDGSNAPVKDQLINLRLIRLTDPNNPQQDDAWEEVENPPMFTKLRTADNGRVTFDIFTFQLQPGSYRIMTYYGGNKYDDDVEIEDKLESSTSEGLLIINPPGSDL